MQSQFNLVARPSMFTLFSVCPYSPTVILPAVSAAVAEVHLRLVQAVRLPLLLPYLVLVLVLAQLPLPLRLRECRIRPIKCWAESDWRYSSSSGSVAAATSNSAHTTGSQSAVVSARPNAAVGGYSAKVVIGGLASFVAVAGVLLF